MCSTLYPNTSLYYMKSDMVKEAIFTKIMYHINPVLQFTGDILFDVNIVSIDQVVNRLDVFDVITVYPGSFTVVSEY